MFSGMNNEIAYLFNWKIHQLEVKMQDVISNIHASTKESQHLKYMER